MKRTITALTAVLLALAVLSVILLPAAVAFLFPPAYSATFVGALDEKVERLRSVEGKKAIVVGGSSVAFGLDSTLMEEHLGMPVVNFGLYAAIGTRAMLELSLPSVGEGDLVILAPEINAETLSLYFSGENMWKAIDDAPSLFFRLAGDSQKQMLGSLYSHASQKLAALASIPDPQGVYSSKSFDSNGDIAYPRPSNVMPLYYDPNTPIVLSPSIVSEDFIAYLNEYIGKCKEKGAEVYFTYSPMNEAAVADGADAYALEGFLREKIACEHISLIDSYLIDKAYFYDTNFHLNDAGVILRTRQLLEDIRIAQGNFTAVDIDIPEKPALPNLDFKFFGEDENAGHFVYESLQNGALSIVGLTELGKQQSDLVIPLGASYTKVIALSPNALAGAKAKTLTVTADTNLRTIASGAFDGCDLSELHILYDFTDEAEKLSPPASFGGVKVFVPRGSTYLSHYDWSNYDLSVLPDARR